MRSAAIRLAAEVLARATEGWAAGWAMAETAAGGGLGCGDSGEDGGGLGGEDGGGWVAISAMGLAAGSAAGMADCQRPIFAAKLTQSKITSLTRSSRLLSPSAEMEQPPLVSTCQP